MNARKKTTIYCQGQSQYVAYDFEFANARTSERCETIVIHYERKRIACRVGQVGVTVTEIEEPTIHNVST